MALSRADIGAVKDMALLLITLCDYIVSFLLFSVTPDKQWIRVTDRQLQGSDLLTTHTYTCKHLH